MSVNVDFTSAWAASTSKVISTRSPAFSSGSMGASSFTQALNAIMQNIMDAAAKNLSKVFMASVQINVSQSVIW